MQIVRMMIPPSKHGLKCPFPMRGPDGLVYHDTYNSVSAMSEASFSGGNDWQVSSHVYVDEARVVQSVLFSRNAWHAGDGGEGIGNRRFECVEVCRSRSDLATYKAAQDLACRYIAYRLRELRLPFVPGVTVRTHQSFSGKYCPHRTLSEGLWPAVLGKIKRYYDNSSYVSEAVLEEEKMDVLVYLRGDEKSRAYAEAISQRTGIPIIPNPGFDLDKWRGRFNRIVAMGGTRGAHTSYATHFCETWKDADDFPANPDRYATRKGARQIQAGDKVIITGGRYLQYAGGPEGAAVPQERLNVSYTVDKVIGDSCRIVELWSWIDKKNLK